MMGVFSVPIKICNWQNRFLPPEKQGEEVVCDALVDSGAVELALPTELIDRLKLEHVGAVNVYTADGGQHEYRFFGMAEIEVQGRVAHVRAIELPRGAEPLLRAVPLEEMDWHISPAEKKLLPASRSITRPPGQRTPRILSRQLRHLLPSRRRNGTHRAGSARRS